MDEELNHSSVESDSTGSPVPFESPVLSYIPRRFHRSLVVPSILSERKSNSHATLVKLPPLKFSSTLPTNEAEDFLASSSPTTERELTLFKQKFNRLRITLSKSHEFNLYTCEKVRQKKSDLRRAVHDQKKLIDQLLTTSSEVNNKIKELRDEITKQCHKRDTHELRQLKLRNKLNHVNQIKDRSAEILQAGDKTRLIEQYDAHLCQLKADYQDEIADRDRQIEKLKEELSAAFGYQANEHKKLLRAATQAFNIENQKCEALQEFVDDYESNVYRAKKSCCTSTSYRLSKLSTQLRLYSIIESTLNELFHSSCSCGQFKRCHQTYMRLHHHHHQ